MNGVISDSILSGYSTFSDIIIHINQAQYTLPVNINEALLLKLIDIFLTSPGSCDIIRARDKWTYCNCLYISLAFITKIFYKEDKKS